MSTDVWETGNRVSLYYMMPMLIINYKIKNLIIKINVCIYNNIKLKSLIKIYNLRTLYLWN